MGSVVWYPGAHAGRPSGALFLPARLWGSVARPVPFHFWLGVSCLVTSLMSPGVAVLVGSGGGVLDGLLVSLVGWGAGCGAGGWCGCWVVGQYSL